VPEPPALIEHGAQAFIIAADAEVGIDEHPLSRMPKINRLPNFIVDALSSFHRVFVVG
jgi:hypothetical protein